MISKRAGNRLANLGWIVLAIVVLVAVRVYTHRGIVQGIAPPIEGASLTGERLSLTALRGGPVLIHFWATWCPICRSEHGSIESIARDYPVITVAMQSGGAAEIQSYVRQHALHAPVLVDEFGDLARTYGVRAVPASFILDWNGVIRSVEVGYTTEVGLRVRLWLAGL